MNREQMIDKLVDEYSAYVFNLSDEDLLELFEGDYFELKKRARA